MPIFPDNITWLHWKREKRQFVDLNSHRRNQLAEEIAVITKKEVFDEFN